MPGPEGIEVSCHGYEPSVLHTEQEVQVLILVLPVGHHTVKF